MNQSGPNRTQNGAQKDEEEDLSVCRIAPWNNKEEFVRVYQLLFGPNTTADSKRQACEYMRVWKIRRQYLTPASVLSTLTILDVYLQDDCLAASQSNGVGDSAARQLVLRQLYAHSFTRFLNYMSSILQSRHMKTMYTTAQELGLDSFLVDLRHLCAHGHDLPALDVFQRAVTHLLDWLHEFYWQRELQHIRDATVRDVRTTKAVEFEAYAESLLHVYDTATEALHRRCRLLNEIRGGQPFDEEEAWSLKKYGAYYKLDRLSVIAGRVTNELTQLAARESRVRGHDQIFCAALLRCRHFMESAAAAAVSEGRTKLNGESDKQQQRTNDLIGQHQNLFRALAVCGFIETCFHGLVAICEDEHETTVRRRGAQFWANQVAAGFQLFKEVKRAFKTKKERNSEFEMDLAPLNTDAMTPEIREVYRRLGVNCGGVLIFGDTIRRPWTLSLSRRYMNERATAVNEYTRDVLVKCMGLVEPPLSADESETLRGLMALFVAAGTEVGTSGDESTVAESSGPDDVYTVDDREAELRRLVAGQEMAQEAEEVNEEGRQTFGIWSEVSDDFNWKSVPLGRVPWE